MLITPAEINELNAEFWANQTQLMDRRVNDPRIRAVALHRFARDQRRGIPIYSQKSLEVHLEEAEEDVAIFQREIAKAAGRALRKDALNDIVIELLDSKPALTVTELRHFLTRERYPGVIEDVTEDEIAYRHGNQLRAVPIDALKDRLSRIRKKQRSR